jgi:hypothetical protein
MEVFMETYKLIQPIVYDGENITELQMNLDGMGVPQLEKAERMARSLLDKKENMLLPATNQKYCACVASIAAGVKLDLIRNLKANDYTQVCVMVQNFLLGGGSTSEDLESEDEQA